VGPAGELYVADTGNDVVRRVSADGVVSTLASCTDAARTDCLKTPTGVAVDATGTVYVTESGHSRVRKIAPDGTFSTYAGSGSSGFSDSADLLAARFDQPVGLAIGPDGALYVADYNNDAIRRCDASGVTTVAHGLSKASGVAVANDGAVYFVSAGSGQLGVVRYGIVQVFANADGVHGDQEGPGATARLRPLDGLVVGDQGLVFSDTANYRVRSLALDGDHSVATVLGDGQAADGSDSGAHVVLPRGLTRFQGGYAVADSGNHRIVWFPDPATK
jgi:DNA-binding beta-propeller fold protein YncE